MISRFAPRPSKVIASSRPLKDEVYNLRGLNMVIPDQVLDSAKTLNGQSPYTINSRMLARDTDEERVAIRTRKGSEDAFGLEDSADTPLDVKHDAAITGELEFSSAVELSSKFTVPTYSLAFGSYCLNKLTMKLRKTTGYIESILVEIRANDSGVPGNLLATSSFSRTDVGTVSADVSCKFVDAPVIASGAIVWITLKLIGSTTASAFVKVTSTTGGLSRTIGATTGPWTANNKSFYFLAPSYRSGIILGAHRRVVDGETSKTIVATGYGPLIWFDNERNTGSVYAYSSSYNALSNKFRFAQVDNLTAMVNGVIQPRYWDGAAITTLVNAPLGASHLFIWKNRAFALKDNIARFTDLLETTAQLDSWPSVNFFYPDTPTTPDHLTAYAILQDSLILFTKNTKYIVFMGGAGISTINIREVEGSKGALSQEVVGWDKNYVYFIADDKRMYRFNLVEDELVSDGVEPEIRAAQEPELNAYLHVYDNQVRYYYAKSPSAEINRRLIYDITQNEWFLDTGVPVARSIEHDLEDNRLVELSSKTTMAMLGNQGYNDLGKPIDFKYWTPYKAYSSGAAKDRTRKFRPVIKITGRRFTMQVGKDVDFANNPDMRDYLVSSGSAVVGDGSEVGDGTVVGGRVLVDDPASMSGRGKHTQFRFEKNGVDTPVELYGYIHLFKVGKDK